MISLLTAFFTSLITTLLIIRYDHLHSHLSADSDLSGPQKFHQKIVPRIGGISIAFGVFLATLSMLDKTPDSNIEIILLLCAIPVFAIGFFEDITRKISVRKRLFFTIISAVLVVYLLKIQIIKLDIQGVDFLFTIPLIGTIFTVFSITGLANAYNIIDGFHGLSSMVGIITLLAISYLGFVVADLTIIYLSLIMIGAILGFFIWNYPRGLIFLGDGGAYLIGFWIAVLSILLVTRHQEISPWFALLINSYPIVETLFTIYRRVVHQRRSPGQPDGVHFHTIVYRRILMKKYRNENWFSANSRTAPYFWILSALGITPAVLWWYSTPILMCASLVFVALYVWLYASIVRFRTPKWLNLEK
jgi:UDP-GlcNAc:undecaprenyl-phosphate GlcNAc-1-phosphate transferase